VESGLNHLFPRWSVHAPAKLKKIDVDQVKRPNLPCVPQIGPPKITLPISSAFAEM
jgi:hypothetical protein